MKAWCPNCANRTKADRETWDTNGGDFWWCEAKPLLPAFAGCFVHGNMTGRTGQPINLNNFERGSAYHDYLAAKDCPLFTPKGD